MQAISDVQERDLRRLLEAFGYAFVLEDIATAYCEADRNVDLAAEILCASHGTAGNNLATSASNDKFKGASEPTISPSSVTGGSAEPADMPSASKSQKFFLGQRSSGAVKSKVHPASLGTVSGIVRRDYIQPKTSTKPYQEVNKPLKLDAKELPASEIWAERPPVNTSVSKGTMRDDVVNFLFNMLGDGFELDKNKIHEVLGLCGYDVQKTMEKLLLMSASTLEKCDDVYGLAGEISRDQHSDVDFTSSEEAGTILCNSNDSPKRDKDRVGLQREVLESLFSFPQSSEEAPKRKPRVRAKPYGRSVVGLPQDTTTVQRTTVEESQIVKEESDDDENKYEVLRKAVREHWITMREYYRAAVDAFAKGDYARADRLLEKGHFYDRKAREADEKSAQKLLQTNEPNDDAIPLDLHEHEPKQALRLLKFHLTSLSGIHAIKYMRVVVGTGDEDSRGTRKRLIVKQLEKDSIKWTEEDDGRTLRLQVDVIDPKRLSFARTN